MTQMHAVYPPIWHATFVTCHHASLSSFLSVSTVKDGKKKNNNKSLRADFENYFFPNINNVFLWCVFFSRMYSCRAGPHRWNLKACCPVHLRDKQEESCGGAGNKPPTPSPSGHGAILYLTIDFNYDNCYWATCTPQCRWPCGADVRAMFERGTCGSCRRGPIGGDANDPLRAPLRSKRGAGEWSGARFTLKEPKWVGVESRGDSIGLAQHFWTYNSIPYTIVNINKTGLCDLKEKRSLFPFPLLLVWI